VNCVAVLLGVALGSASVIPQGISTAPARTTMTTFTSRDGVPIACERTGSGPPLVLVHGTAADRSRWAPVLPALSARLTVYACDRRGRGASGDQPAYAMEREFEDVAAIVDGIGGPVDLVGHSYGALCALEAAVLARNVRRLVLYEPPIPAGIPITPEGVIDRLQALLDAGDRDGVVATFMREVPRVPPEQVGLMRSLPAWRARVGAAATIPRELRAHDRYTLAPEKFRNVKVPVLLLLGGDSPPFFRAALDRIQAAVPGARIVVLPGQQHVAIDTAPDLFAREVLDFLTQ
jgi:pimeloyl-ACP methyl ester carboxylesterase